MAFGVFSEKIAVGTLCKFMLILSPIIYLIFIFIPSQYSYCSVTPLNRTPQVQNSTDDSPTNLNHLVFGLLGSEQAWHERKQYIESWWRPKTCRGFLYLDKNPTGELLPWSKASPPYRISKNLTKFLVETKALAPVMIRMVHAILEVFKEADNDDREDFRWLVMGDDDSIFFVENIVDVLAKLDHRKYYYLGGQSEYIMSNYWFSFNQGFGGAGFILSYPLAKALAEDMESCLRRYAQLSSADLITMVCIADIGVNLSPHKGIHQIDLHGDISGFLSSHPKSPLISLHHLDGVEPIFPAMDRFQSTHHLMKAASVDQSRILQQTICHDRRKNLTFSISWGYSVHIYERILPRSFLQNPIETFKSWTYATTEAPHYMFNTRLSTNNPRDPHVFFFKKVKKMSKGILTIYSGNSSEDFVSEINVLSSRAKRKEIDRCECCDIVGVYGSRAKIKFRECMVNEIIA